jgi:hypothetical protein
MGPHALACRQCAALQSDEVPAKCHECVSESCVRLLTGLRLPYLRFQCPAPGLGYVVHHFGERIEFGLGRRRFAVD